MQKTTREVIACLLLLLALCISCSEKEKACAPVDTPTTQALNPNGDSELALLMRAMFDEAVQIKRQVANEEPISLKIDYEKILTAHATEPEKAASVQYQAFAKSYLQSIKDLQSASPAQGEAFYLNMVENCMTCHKALCPGPMVVIKKLR